MNKFYILLLLAITSSLSLAQDIIITKDKERILAKILEVSMDDVKYKKFTYQNGPIFTLDIDKILTIAYENGEVEVYDEKFIQEKNERVLAQAEALRQKEAMYGTFVKEDDFYYLCYDSKITKMDEKAYLQFIEQNCPEAYKKWTEGYTLWNAGWGLLSSGLALGILVGTPLCAVGKAKHNENCRGIGTIFTTVGALATAGSIPLFIVGGIKKNNSYEEYNDHCKQTDEFYIVLQTNSNGIGLALNF